MTERTPEENARREAEYHLQDEARRRERRSRLPFRRNTRAPALPPSRVPVTPPAAEPKDSPSEIRERLPEPAEARSEAGDRLLAVQDRPARTEVRPPGKPEAVRRLEFQLWREFPFLDVAYYTLTQADLEFLERHLTTLPALIESMLDKFVTQAAERRGIVVRLFSEGTSPSGESKGIRVRLEARILPGQAAPFTLNQAYSAETGELALKIESIVAPGRGKEFFKVSVLPQAKRFGIRKITLDASNLGIFPGASGAASNAAGVTAWARYGFVPTRDAWDTMRNAGMTTLSDHSWASVRSQLKRIMTDPSPKALRRLVFLAWQERKTLGQPGLITKFLDTFLGSNWSGEIDLSDPDSKGWLETYINASRPEDHLGTFERLLSPPTIVKGDYTFRG